MPNDTNNLEDKTVHNKDRSGLIKALIVLLIVLIIIIILLLLKSCNRSIEMNGPTILEPDYPIIDIDPDAEPIENEPSGEASTISQGGGSMTISFKDKATYSLSTGKISMFYQNPSTSTHNVVAQMILVREEEHLLAQSGILKPGYQVTSMTADKNAPKLSPGGYNGKIRLRFYNPETGERAIVDTDIPCTITVTE